jgi:mono/diheme cytochrome c family protein
MLPRRMTAAVRKPLLAASLAAAALGLAACGTQSVDLAADDPNRQGAVLFDQKCSGCHTLSKSGSQGGAFEIADRERIDGPSFDARPQTVAGVLYAIRNGGYSGAIMPENIVTGREANAIARFLAKYSGTEGESESTQTSFGNEQP